MHGDPEETQPILSLEEMVEVEWLDAHSRGGWEYIAEVIKGKALTVNSTGYLVANNADVVILAQSMDGQGKVADCIYIPQGMKPKITKLQGGKKVSPPAKA